MASPNFYASLFLLFLHFHLTPAQGEGEKLIFEDGYTVTTVLDGDKSNFKVNPHSITHQSPPSDLFVLLDSVASTFYTVSLPTTSNETVIQRLAGNGEPGYKDGDLDSASFNKPRSFAVDFSGNVYVADQRKHTIRKITKSGLDVLMVKKEISTFRISTVVGVEWLMEKAFIVMIRKRTKETQVVNVLYLQMLALTAHALDLSHIFREHEPVYGEKMLYSCVCCCILFSSLQQASFCVTTIAGGSSQKAGRKDGPGRDASFSDDFELTFIPQRCALMISDHGNRLVRQINLKAEDCTRHSGSVLGTTSAWLLGLGLSCLLGLIVGFVIRPYVIPYEGFKPLRSSWTWTRCLTSLERQIAMLCSVIRSVIVKSTIYSLSRRVIILSLSQLSLMFRPMTVKSRSAREKPVSLLDLDAVCSSSSGSSSNIFVSPGVDEELKDLLTFGGGPMLPVNANGIVEQEEESESTDVFSDEHDKIDSMIRANLVYFEEQATRVCANEPVECSLGLVKRR
ncbi:hypothetical protein DH2020_027021 [Rehmannia glutinosa]|uniref:NHL domain-containing protein n=1 Tax=Rehmannia glutinosa TaxID=99300 RepID=A0ABR0VV91_REHGL